MSETTATPASSGMIFVGNLPFSLTEAELTTMFAAYGAVVNSRIIKRRSTSLGYGFVEMENEESAVKAIAALNKSEISGRAINVELSKETGPRKTTTTTSTPTTTSTKPSGRSRRPKTTSDAAPVSGDAPSTSSTDSTAAGASTGRPKRRSNTKRRSDAEVSPAATSTTPAEPKAASPDTLFVTNVPFSVDNEKFLALFKDFSPKSAHIVINSRSNRSRGYGFVVFNTTAEQQNALAVNNTEIDGRKISVKVAYLHEEKPAETATETPVAAN
ncbi:hypothetical protein SAMD00019534_035130, partial [Acytostelium subglobosum LB1]|uniref:hypothetical protein n=1 Tax=Acytostelium subglobosum LB1 TaxID=1410327 RepID=UPI000644B030